MKTYYTMAVCEAGQWGAQFGDFDKSVVEQERLDFLDSNPYKPSDLRILKTDPSQAAIDLAVALLNGRA